MRSTVRDWDAAPAEELPAPDAAVAELRADRLARGGRARRFLARLVLRAVLWLTFAFYALLHVMGVVQADRGMATVGLAGMAVVALASWLHRRGSRWGPHNSR